MASGWSPVDALNKNSKAAMTEKPKARFRTKDISIKRMYSNKNNFYSMQGIEKLAQEILVSGLIENLTVTYEPSEDGEYRIIAGERRWRALTLLVERGYTEFEMATCQIKTVAEEHEEMVLLIMANGYRDKTAADILEEEKQLKDSLQYMKDNGIELQGYSLESGRMRDVIAQIMNTSAARVAQIESINNRLIPEFAEELKEGRLTFSAAYEISGMAEEAQQEMLARYKENGLSYKEVKEEKARAAAAEEAKQLDGQMTLDKLEEPWQEDEEEQEEEQDEEQEEEWQQAHPEGITSICYGCQRYSDCNVKSSTCTNCDRYINKAEAEKTAEQRYNEEQDAIDRETAKKLKEQAQEEKMNSLPSQSQQTVHELKIGHIFFGDAATGKKPFELRKNDRNFKVGDKLKLMEYEDGKYTGRAVLKNVTYMLEDYTGLDADFCILGCTVDRVLIETGQDAAADAAADAAQPTTPEEIPQNLEYGA